MAISWPTVESALGAWVELATGLAADKILWAGQNAPRPTGAWASLRLMSQAEVGHGWVSTADNPIVLADDDVDAVLFATDQLTVTGHAYSNAVGPVRFVTTGALPGGLALATDYWLIVDDASTVRVAATFANAVAASPTVIALADAGIGTHTIQDTADTANAGAEITHSATGDGTAQFDIQVYEGAVGDTSARARLARLGRYASLPATRAALRAAGVAVATVGPVTGVGDRVTAGVFEPRAVVSVTLNLLDTVTETGTYIETVGWDFDPPLS